MKNQFSLLAKGNRTSAKVAYCLYIASLISSTCRTK